MQNPVPIPHEAGPDLAGGDLPGAALRVFRQGGVGREGGGEGDRQTRTEQDSSRE